MGIYDCREEPAYRNTPWRTYAPKNFDVPRWWTPEHDRLLAERIGEEQWHWYWGIADEILAITPPGTLGGRKSKDPLNRRQAWYNVLMNLAGARADKLGLTKAIRKPKWKTCPLCGQRFVEDSLPVPLTDRLGFDRLDFCAPCLAARCFQGTGVDDLPREETLEYLRRLAGVLQRVPNQGFGEGKDDLRHLACVLTNRVEEGR